MSNQSVSTPLLAATRRLALLLAPFDAEDRSLWVERVGTTWRLTDEGVALARQALEETQAARPALLEADQHTSMLDCLCLSLIGALANGPETGEWIRAPAQVALQEYEALLEGREREA